MSARVLQLNAKDNVLVALSDLRQGEEIAFAGRTYKLKTEVPAKHKFASEEIGKDGAVVMYGVLIGKAMEPIGVGERVTTRNTHHEAAAFHEKTEQYQWHAPDIEKWKGREFLGYHREDGQVGTRNYWLVAPLVFCENRNIAALKQAFEEELGFAAPPVYRQQVAELVGEYRRSGESDPKDEATGGREKVFQNVDGIKFLLHEAGCGGTREDATNLCGLIAGYIHHPNVAGATVLSLGCQHSQTAILREELKKRSAKSAKPLYVFEQQQSGSEFAMLSQAIRKTFEGLVEANKLKRE